MIIQTHHNLLAQYINLSIQLVTFDLYIPTLPGFQHKGAKVQEFKER